MFKHYDRVVFLGEVEDFEYHVTHWDKNDNTYYLEAIDPPKDRIISGWVAEDEIMLVDKYNCKLRKVLL